MNCPTLSKVPGHLRMARQYQICFGEVSLHLQIDLNTLGVLSVQGDKNLNLYINIFSFFIVNSSLMKLDQAC